MAKACFGHFSPSEPACKICTTIKTCQAQNAPKKCVHNCEHCNNLKRCPAFVPEEQPSPGGTFGP